MTDAVEIAPDRFALRPIVIPVAAALFVGAAFSFLQLPIFAGSWLLLGLLSLVLGTPALLVWLIIRLIHLVKAARQRMWRKAISQLLILACVLPLMDVALIIGPYVHFGLSYPYYVMKVKQSPDGGSKPITFNWGGSGFVGSAQTDRWLVYDPTDETAARPKFSQGSEDDPDAWYEVEHLIERFYLVERHQG